MPNKVTFREGDVFAVPLEQGGYILGLIARKTKIAPLGYFFDKVYISPPNIEQLEFKNLKVLTSAVFGTVGLTRGEWPIIGKLPEFRREEWPVPLFRKEDPVSGVKYAVEYADADFGSHIAIHNLPDAKLNELPEDGVMGYLYLVDVVSESVSQL